MRSEINDRGLPTTNPRGPSGAGRERTLLLLAIVSLSLVGASILLYLTVEQITSSWCWGCV